MSEFTILRFHECSQGLVPCLKRSVFWIVFWILAFASVFLNIGLPVTVDPEGAVMASAAEIIRTGSWGISSIDPGLCPVWVWLVSLTALPFRGVVTEFTARLPGAVCALLLLYLSVRFARSLFGETTARLAGWLMLSCSTFVSGARFEGECCANVLVTFASIAYLWKVRNTRNVILWCLFWLLAAAGSVFLTSQTFWIAAWCAFVLKFKEIKTNPKQIILFIAEAVPGIALWYFFGKTGYPRVTDSTLQFFPWTIFLVLASTMYFILSPEWDPDLHEETSNPAWSRSLLPLLLISLVIYIFALEGYIPRLLLLPFAAAAAAFGLLNCPQKGTIRKWYHWSQRIGCMLLIAGAFECFIFPWMFRAWFAPDLFPAGAKVPLWVVPLVDIGTPFAGFMILLYGAAVWKNKWDFLGNSRMLTFLVPTVCGIVFISYAIVIPLIESDPAFRPQKTFLKSVSKTMQAHELQRIAFFGTIPATVQFYLNLPQPVCRLHTKAELDSFIESAKKTGGVLIGTERNYEKIGLSEQYAAMMRFGTDDGEYAVMETLSMPEQCEQQKQMTKNEIRGSVKSMADIADIDKLIVKFYTPQHKELTNGK